ncbi:DsrH/TusB family sulfur metabolism protein [Marinomonas transparens]|uniref:Protein TusB n=1 Tax=Marinomonas transparens TaxID=2795388 RepID=A0A934N0F7_9GAMM|nr:DsrH/TusB family sulfur metabolism protein [Marinomonas transparens]MBJ7536662.1 hypothetical protein [Marinomonas transparens]
MQLHQINQLAYSSDLESLWQDSLQAGDSLLLIEDGILRTNNINDLRTLIESKKVSLYYLQSDADAYGLSPTIGTALSDSEWVDITLSAQSNISW